MNNGWYSRIAAIAVIAGGVGVSPVGAQSLIFNDTDSVIIDYSALNAPARSSRSSSKTSRVASAPAYIPSEGGVYIAPWDCDCTVQAPPPKRTKKTRSSSSRSVKRVSAPAFVAPSPPRRTLPSSTEVNINYGALDAPELMEWPGFPFEDSHKILLVSPSEQQETPQLTLKRSTETHDTLLTLHTDEPASVKPPPLPSPVSLLGPRNVVVAFPSRSAAIPYGSQADLDALKKILSEDTSLRATIRAYGEGKVADTARRLSLERALAIRTYLTRGGISSKRIDIEALGNKTKLGNSNTASIDIAG